MVNWAKDKDALFRWAIGIIAAAVMAGGGMLWAHEAAITENKTEIKNNRERADRSEVRNDDRLKRIEDKLDRLIERIVP